MKFHRNKRSITFFLLLYFSLAQLIFTSCFSRFVLNDKEIDHYYSRKEYKPAFHFLNYEGRTIHYAEFGNSDKPLLLLIHGAPGAWYTWRNMIDLDTIRHNFHIIAVDRHGYGKSNYGTFEPDIQVQINLIQQILLQFPEKDLYLAGRSYGAPIAVALASQNPEHTKRLLLYSPVLSPFHEKKYWFSMFGKWKLVRWFLPKALNVATDEKYEHITQMRQLLPLYPQVSNETIIISGEKDWVAHSQNFKIADSLLCGAKKCNVLLKKAGHFLTFQYPQSMSFAIYEPYHSILALQLELMVNEEENRRKQNK